MDGVRKLEHRGCTLAWRARGAGPAVLWIQGVGLHGDGWAPQVDALKGRFRCITFDNRGVAGSVPLGCALSVPQMAEDARAVLDAAGVDSAHVVGHSLGGLVALELALAMRPRVRSLALLCTFARGRSVAPLTWRMMTLGLRRVAGTRRGRRRAFLELVFRDLPRALPERDALAERMAPLFGHDLADLDPIVKLQIRAMRAHDVTPRLSALASLPTLVVSALHDRIAPPALGRTIAEHVPGARFVELPDAAHGAPIERAARMNALLAEHFEQGGADLAGRKRASRPTIVPENP